jgi:hypothetical protein
MTPKTIKVNVEVPDGISDQARQAVQTQAEEAAVLGLWKAGELSTRRAAEELGLTYYDFLDLLAARGIPVVGGGELNAEAIEAAERKLAVERP